MKTVTMTPEFQVTQAVGSMAIEGIRVSAVSQGMMKRVARGEVSLDEARRQVLARYRTKHRYDFI
jgi:hypothetical protein